MIQSLFRCQCTILSHRSFFLLESSMTTLKSTMKIVNYSSSCKKNIQSSRKLSMNLICVPTAKTSLHFALWTLSNDYLGKYSFKIHTRKQCLSIYLFNARKLMPIQNNFLAHKTYLLERSILMQNQDK